MGDLLKKQPETIETFFRNLDVPETEVQFVVESCKNEILNVGEFFVREGDSNLKVGFILSGLFKASYSTATGKEFVRGFYRENEVMAPLSSILTGEISNITISALENCRILSIPGTTYINLFERHSCWEKFGRTMAQNSMIRRELRERSLLTESASERLGLFNELYGSIAHRVRKRDIAAWVGITAEALSRLNSTLKTDV